MSFLCKTFLLTVVADESQSQEAAAQDNQDQEMADVGSNRDDMDALECRVKPDGAVNMCVEMVSIV